MKTRRNFFKTSGLAVAGAILTPELISGNKPKIPVALNKKELYFGLASYTTREFSLDDTMKMAERVGLKRIGLKSFHLALSSTDQECKAVAEKLKAAGFDFYNAGVIYMKTTAEIDQAFNYAKSCGIRIIIGVPAHEHLDYTVQKIKETDIKLAIHNHGPGDTLYPTIQSIYDKIKTLDHRLGICMDIGHIVRLDSDPSAELTKYFDRIMEIHIKDEDQRSAEGKPIEIGRGVTDIPGFLKTIVKLNYQGGISFEYEKDPKDPLPGLAESVGYVKGVMATI
jgi:inosose dehydratase